MISVAIYSKFDGDYIDSLTRHGVNAIMRLTGMGETEREKLSLLKQVNIILYTGHVRNVAKSC